MNLRQLCDQLGITLGCGLVDHLGPFPFPENDSTGAYSPTNPDVQLILNNFGAITLHAYCFELGTPADQRGVNTWIGPYEYDWRGADAAYNFAIANGLKVTIQNPEYPFNYAWVQDENENWVYSVQFPSWIADPSNVPKFSPAELTNMLHAFTIACYSRYPLAYLTHVCNERFGAPNWLHEHSTIGSDPIAAFVTISNWVHAINPTMKIIYNQTGILNSIPTAGAAWAAKLQEIRAAGGVIHGIADQGHEDYTHAGENWNNFATNIAAIKAAGFEFFITELDCTCPTTSDIPAQQQVYREFLRTVINSGSTELSLWGARPPECMGAMYPGGSGVLFFEDRSEAPPYSAVFDLLTSLAGAPRVARKLRSPSGGKIRGKGAGKVSGKPQ